MYIIMVHFLSLEHYFLYLSIIWYRYPPMLFSIFCVMANFQRCSYNTEYSYFDILPMSKSLVTSKIFDLEVFYQVCFPYGGVRLDLTLLPTTLRLYGWL